MPTEEDNGYDPRRGPRDRSLRVGDREREAVAEILRQHHVEGRLDTDEFQERLERCLAAKTHLDLDRLIHDLPSHETEHGRLGRARALPFWRGVPLITVLFFATYMLPFFLPDSWRIDALARVLIGVVLFAGAYMAEVVRGGLQAIPRGQFEGAMALGLGYWRTMGFVILPQALRLVIPGIVNSFIALFKDTTLVLIVAIFDLLGQLRAAFADPTWATPVTLFTGFAFAGMIYFVVSFGMSRYALFMERRLNIERLR